MRVYTALEILAFIAALYILRLERFRREEWQQVATDLAFAALSFVGYLEVAEAAIGIGFGSSPLQSGSLEVAGQLGVREFLAGHKVVAFFAFLIWTSYFNYWIHRLSHKIGALWELHKVHHAAKRMTGLSKFRFHPLEDAINTYLAAVLTCLLLPDLGSRSAENYGLFIAVYTIAIHSEFRWQWRWCSWIVQSPAMHQLHHSTNPKHFDVNFGAPFIVWDRLHGTYLDPLKTDIPTAFGVEGVEAGGFSATVTDPLLRFFKRLVGDQPVLARLRSFL